MKVPDLRAVIIDDEPPAREVLLDLLSAHPNVKVIGEAFSVNSAFTLCHDLRPNLLFLDVQMEDGDGFDLLARLMPMPTVIFVTAFETFALKAFKVNAIDYLVKPASPERLAHALERIRYQPKDLFAEKLSPEDKVFYKEGKDILIAFVSEICGIEAQDNYSLVHLPNGRTRMVRRSMAEWEARLPSTLFCRLNRSLIVNLEKIHRAVIGGRDEMEIGIEGFSETVHIGRQAGVILRRAMGQSNML